MPSIQCIYMNVLDEETGEERQCEKYAIRGGLVCKKHGGQLPTVQKAAQANVDAARLRMMGAAPDAMDVLQGFLLPGTTEGVRLKAALEILDRAGLKAGQEVNVTVEHVGSPINEILEQLAVFTESGNTDDDIVDAETEEEFDDPDSDI
jgi:hypothetical protein